ncbi:MCE family protein [Mycobacterium branderi]|uniref:Mammalian cell entry protein n=1 Tax=Mycobacterium branderi TaxID=43348 RepID=A0A7I7WFC8_9MYCO|nr:MlaD family protein [Mycobacterium branderi]MCV7236328.1 MCE family protein [Mycobacterium branderi]ORA35493.1 mammalian cell entry protein [Mycobacterium branderi]BBZ15213.1 mammalian cell entry protein [Mycobacterium branderi]
MRMNRRIWTQLTVLIAITATAFMFMAFGYMRLPTLLFGVGHYRVTVQLPEAAGLYERANVTYLGTEVGQVKSVELTDSGINAVLSLRSDVKIPANLDARVHSTSAVGEQYVELLPRAGESAPLKTGDVIPLSHSSVPPDVNELLNATNRGLQAIPGENLKTVIDESYTAIGGLGPELSRIVKGSTRLAIDARKNLDELTNVIDNVAPVLNTQTDTSESVQAWAAHMADITRQLKDNDVAVRNVLHKGSGAMEEVRDLFDRLQPTLPIVMANLASIAPVLVTYHAGLEQILVLVPLGTAAMQAVTVANQNTKQDYRGAYLSFNLNFNLPPPCTTGYLPIQQQRVPTYEDYPDRPAGDVYCRVPQDSMFNVRGARNYPCVTRPGKRAPTVKLCESDESYVPLNDGFNWKGDPNATLSGQDIPQLPPGSTPAQQLPPNGPAPSPIAAAEYDPATGSYVGPDGNVYTQSNLAQTAPKEQTWQSMLIPPTAR